MAVARVRVHERADHDDPTHNDPTFRPATL
jgi:hypothetical protein